jgi:hypothetical protein
MLASRDSIFRYGSSDLQVGEIFKRSQVEPGRERIKAKPRSLQCRAGLVAQCEIISKRGAAAQPPALQAFSVDGLACSLGGILSTSRALLENGGIDTGFLEPLELIRKLSRRLGCDWGHYGEAMKKGGTGHTHAWP